MIAKSSFGPIYLEILDENCITLWSIANKTKSAYTPNGAHNTKEN